MKYKYTIGVDISKNTLDVFVKKDNKNVVYTRINSNKEGFKALEKALKKANVPLNETLFCAEHTGYYSYSLLTWIEENELDLWLEAPLAIKRSSGLKRGKSDKSDAENIASYAYKNQCDCNLWQIPSKALKELKKLNQGREKLITSIGRYEKPIKERKEIGDNEPCDIFKNTLIGLKKDLKKSEKKMYDCVIKNANLSRCFDIVTSIPGIGTITAIVLIIATNEFKRIKTAKKLACFAGIAPFEHTSGTSIKGKNRVSHFASKKIKKMLHMAALTLIKLPGELRDFYDKLVAKGKAKMVAINALRRKLIDRIYACIAKNRKYEKNYM